MSEPYFLLLTILVETTVACLLMPRSLFVQVLTLTIAVNCISHPLAWLAYQHGTSWSIIEACVILFEGLVFYRFFDLHRGRAVLTAIAMNIISALIGLWLF